MPADRRLRVALLAEERKYLIFWPTQWETHYRFYTKGRSKSDFKEVLKGLMNEVADEMYNIVCNKPDKTQSDGPSTEEQEAGSYSHPVSMDTTNVGDETSESTHPANEDDHDGTSKGAVDPTKENQIDPETVNSIGHKIKADKNGGIFVPVTRYVRLEKLQRCPHLFSKKLIRILEQHNGPVNKTRASLRKRKSTSEIKATNKKKNKEK